MYDVYEIRKHFPMLNGNKTMQEKPLVFLDNASTTFKPQCVIDAITKYYSETTSNSHRGDYDLCYNMDVEVEETRKTVARFINCDPNEVVFTSGDTMSLNIVAWGYAKKFLKAGDEIVISESEHASNVLPWFEISKTFGTVIKYVELDEEGKITAENLAKVLSNKTKIVSIANVGNVLGYTIDVKECAKLVHSVGAKIFIDGAQSVPHMKTDFKGWDIDVLTFSGHKMCGPTGIGCLIGKYDLLDSIDSMVVGGGDNVDFHKDLRAEYLNPPFKFEAGTQNLAGIVGLKAAIEFVDSLGIENIHKHDQELFDYAMNKLKDYPNIHVYNKNARGSTITFNVEGVFSQDEATLLNHKGIAIRSGLHCAKLLPEFLNVYGTCRASTYLYTTKEEIDAFIDALINGGDILDAYFD